MSIRLQLNGSKTELIWFGWRSLLKKLTEDDLTLQFDSGSVHPVSVVRDLGVMLDCELSIKQHVKKVASSCFYHLHRLKQISRLVGKEVTTQLVSALILSRIDYVMFCLQGCHAPLQTHYNESSTRQLVWCSTSVFEITWHQHWSNFTGCQLQTESGSNSAYWCTWSIQAEHRSIWSTLYSQ